MNAASILVCVPSALGTALIGRKLYILERDERRRRDFQAAAFRNRPKATVIQIGYLIERPDGKPIPTGFAVVDAGHVPAYAAMCDGERVRDLTFGWTNEELVELVRRRKEFE